MTSNTFSRFNLISLVFFLSAFSCSSQAPNTIGLKDGKLRPCPDTPNCVSSEHHDKKSYVQPLIFQGTPEIAWQALNTAVTDIGGKIEQNDYPYLWATFQSRIFRFVDDLECRMDGANQAIHLRSASRVGYSDLGVNKRRVEKLRSRFRKIMEE